MEEDVSEVENNDHGHDETKDTPHNEEEKYKHKFSDDPERKQILFSLVKSQSQSQSIFNSTIWPKAQCTTILQINLVILNLQLISFSHSLHDK